MVGVNPYSEFYGASIVMSRKKPKEASLRDSGAGKGLFIRGLLEDNKREEIFSGYSGGFRLVGYLDMTIPTEPGHPCVTISGNAFSCFERT
jgi:hypothetical protein